MFLRVRLRNIIYQEEGGPAQGGTLLLKRNVSEALPMLQEKRISRVPCATEINKRLPENCIEEVSEKGSLPRERGGGGELVMCRGRKLTSDP